MHAQKASITGIDPMKIPLQKERGHAYITVTPEIAARWLEFNMSNRVFIRQHLELVCRQMRVGLWRDNGEAIKFSAGKLLDGQHRLSAILETGKEQLLTVEYGLDPEVQDTIDTGRKRTPRDVLSIEGMEGWESRTLGSAIHAMIAVDQGQRIYSAVRYTNAECRDYYLEHLQEIESSMRVIKTLPRKPAILPHARALVLHYLFSRSDSHMADEFFVRLHSGENITSDSPIYRLRNRLINDTTSRKKRTTYEQYGFVINAWNRFINGKTMRSDAGIYVGSGNYPEIA